METNMIIFYDTYKEYATGYNKCKIEFPSAKTIVLNHHGKRMRAYEETLNHEKWKIDFKITANIGW